MATEKGIDLEVLGESPDNRPIVHDEALKDSDMDGLTLYEQKALLINRELDAHGMGRYQVHSKSRLRLQGFIRTLIVTVVHLHFMRLWILYRPSLCPGLWARSSCVAARVGLLKYVREQLWSRMHPVNEIVAAELGNIFSAFGAGLCAGVRRHQTNSSGTQRTDAESKIPRPLSGAFWWTLSVGALGASCVVGLTAVRLTG